MPEETFSDWPRYFSCWSAFRLALSPYPSYPCVSFLTHMLPSGEYEHQTRQHDSDPTHLTAFEGDTPNTLLAYSWPPASST
jgi:hypothetical protein